MLCCHATRVGYDKTKDPAAQEDEWDVWGLNKALCMQISEYYEDKDGVVVYQTGDENGADSEEEYIVLW